MSNEKTQNTTIFITALKAAMAKYGLNQPQLAEKTGLSTGGVSAYLSGKTDPGFTNIEKIATCLGLTVAQFFAHEFPEAPDRTSQTLVPSPPPLGAVPEGELESDYHRIPFRDDMRLAAGSGEAPEGFYDVESSPVIIHKATLRRHSAASLAAFRVGGDSMESTIMAGGVIVVDRSQDDWRNLKDKGIYMIGFDDENAVKRLRWAKEGETVAVISDNPIYDIMYRDVDEVRLYGRVIWSWGEH